MSDLSAFKPKQNPSNVCLEGRFVTIESVDWDKHGLTLAKNITGPEHAHLWQYIPVGPFEDLDGLKMVMSIAATQLKWETLVIVSKASAEALGTASYMRIRPEHGSAEVGCIIFSDALQKTKEASEAMYLMAKHIFDDLGYRRYEWKCDNENSASKRAAERLGFQYEGVFRQDMVVRGKNRDTAWYSIIDNEWPAVKKGFESWLSEANFSDAGVQVASLVDCRNNS